MNCYFYELIFFFKINFGLAVGELSGAKIAIKNSFFKNSILGKIYQFF